MQINARNSDPITSHLAGAEIERSGDAASQRKQAYACVVEHPGQTAKELAQITGLDRYMLSRRLPEIAKQGDKRKCAVAGRLCVTWWPFEDRV